MKCYANKAIEHIIGKAAEMRFIFEGLLFDIRYANKSILKIFPFFCWEIE